MSNDSLPIYPLPLHPQNPVARARHSGMPFVYYHSHVVDESTLAASDVTMGSAGSMEFDVYADHNDRPGEARIQHPPDFYVKNPKAPPPASLPLKQAVHTFAAGGQHRAFVLDIKSTAAIPVVQKLVAQIGPERVLVHAFAKDLYFSTDEEAEVKRKTKPHWMVEAQAIEDIVRAASPEGSSFRAAVLLTCRYLTHARLADPQWNIVSRIGAATAGKGVDVVGLWLPRGVAPPSSVARQLRDEHGLLVSFNVDSGTHLDDDLQYVGMTDRMERQGFRRSHEVPTGLTNSSNSSKVALSAKEVAALPDFSFLLDPDYRALYRAWRNGDSQGSKGEARPPSKANAGDSAEQLLIADGLQAAGLMLICGVGVMMAGPSARLWRHPKANSQMLAWAV